MLYAMVLKNRVIDIVGSNVIPEYPPDANNNAVFAVNCDEDVAIGMHYDKQNKKFYEYAEPEPAMAQPTDLELLMQAQADSELRDLVIQQNQELLAQQMTDIEVALLGGDR
ncbi:hypothetical protein [Anaerotignum propionicum]|uniref:Uncharacterized protein n=1 Tax=Anaerotignum propionicum DSM 1682 TaxID=991789 RepID=A0A0X1U7S7_ANAPI|nr:hypothetical protein [Anaerotignum propionicum]AMJ41000.1 hypothetical protein CPRO_14070 [Anaerotignum propionicum DSM 1682]SHE60959.1 hypothetical protein SAMN02745151_01218 [[Clostridium] propionicum DSM 1682] [Anaerotignum propionicum DSM 1682]